MWFVTHYPMPNESLNRLQENLVRIVTADGGAFEKAYGRTARHFLDQLPVLFPVLRRATFDLALPSEARRLMALGVLYVAEPDDYMSEAQFGPRSMLDDCFVIFSAFARARSIAGDEFIARHARVPGTYEELCALADNVSALVKHLPSKVHEQLDTYLS